MAMQRVTIFTDGACRTNPGPGGWAAILLYRDSRKVLSGSTQSTTNNRMELMAAIQALNALKRPCAVELFTDSEYLRNGIQTWLPRWKTRGYRTIEGQPVKNQDLWQKLEEAASPHKVQWNWVRGHAGNPNNELCDQLAKEALELGLNPLNEPPAVLPVPAEKCAIALSDDSSPRVADNQGYPAAGANGASAESFGRVTRGRSVRKRMK